MLRSKSIGKTLALSIALVIFLQYNSYAQKIVYQKKENRYYHEYGISDTWCFECSSNISDLEGKGTKITNSTLSNLKRAISQFRCTLLQTLNPGLQGNME